jgi:hypothetical protein
MPEILEKVKAAIPVNWVLLKNPINWIIVFLMVAIAGAAIGVIYVSTTGASEDNNG